MSATILAAYGVPASLVQTGTGNALQATWRQFIASALRPFGRIVAGELADKLDAPGLKLDFSELEASDVVGRARALKGLVDAGVPLGDALDMVGLKQPDGAVEPPEPRHRAT